MWRWLTLALAVLPGCFDSHGTGPRPTPVPGPGPEHDAGASVVVDAGAGCDRVESPVHELICPASVGVGEPIVVVVTHGTGACCGGAGAGAEAIPRGDAEIEIATGWDACDCCFECECVGPDATASIPIAPRATTGVITVVAGDRRCEIAIEARRCEVIDASEAHVETGVALGEPIPVLLATSAGAGCGCVPEGRVWIGREGPYFAGVEVCDCSDVDPCVDPGYQVTTSVAGASVPTRIEISTTAGTLSTDVIDPAACRPIEPRDVEIEMVAPRALVGSRDVWLRLGLTIDHCCGDPHTLVRHVGGPTGGLALSIDECTAALCGCDPGPRRWEHWHHVGEIASGTHTVTLGTTTTTIVVP